MATAKRRNGHRGARTHLEARYSNYFEVGHNAFEFIFDFGQYHPENEGARIHSRIVTGPVYAKLLKDLLRDALKRYEDEHGEIHPANDDLDPIEIVKQSIANYDRRSNSLRKITEEQSD